MTNIIESLNWRYATKVFDKNKKISKEDLEEIIESFRLTASAYGLQAWKLLVVKNQELKNRLVEASWGQNQVSDCSELLVLGRIEDIDVRYVDKNLDNICETRGLSRSDLLSYENMMKGFIGSIDKDTRGNWMDKQVYIALGNLMTVCAIKKIDSCPMEGILKEKYDEILGLNKKGLKTVLALPIGYRSESDKYASLKKVRFDMEEVVEII